MPDDYIEDGKFLNDIAPDVLRVLRRDRFFDRLDDLFCPEDPSRQAVACNHTFERSLALLKDLGFDSEEIAEVIGVLYSNGGCCDCEVLYNVVEESRLKARYWKSRDAEIVAKETQGDTTI